MIYRGAGAVRKKLPFLTRDYGWMLKQSQRRQTEKWVKFIFACVEPEVSVEHPGKHVQWQLICNAKYIASSQ